MSTTVADMVGAAHQEWCSAHCRSVEPDAGTNGDGHLVVPHDGSRFGAFLPGADIDAMTGELVHASVDFDVVVFDEMGIDGTSDPAVLRRLAADALAAAAWLEARS